MAQSAEARLINALFRADKKTVKVFFESKITPAHMREYGKELNFVVGYFADHRQMPSRTAIGENFPHFPLFKPNDTLEYLCGHIRDREIESTIVEMGETVTEALRDGTIEKAKKSVVMTAMKLSTELSRSRDVNWTTSIDARKKEYLEREKNKGRLGIPTPWPELTDLMLGWQKEHLVTIVARPWVGKTWVAALSALKAWKRKCRVLLITKEMSTGEIEQRLDAAYLKIPFQALRKGELKGKQRDLFLRFGKSFSGMGDFIVSGDDDAGTKGGVQALGAKIREFSPDVVFIDGAYLLEDDRGADREVEKIYHITRDMKRLARKEGIPVIQTIQMGRSGDKKGGGKLKDIQWSDSYSQDSDEVLEIVGDPKTDMRLLKILKQRNGCAGEMTIRFDMDKMDFAAMDASTVSGMASDADKEFASK